MTDYNDINHRHLIEKFEDTERKREKDRQIRHQQGLGQVKTEQQLAQEDYERNEAIWKRTTRGY
jgi:hypothetical protein